MGDLRRTVEIGSVKKRRLTTVDLEMICVEETKQEKPRLYTYRSEVVTLRDGTTLTIRPVRPGDAPRLHALFARLSQDSITSRSLAICQDLPYQQAEDLINLDYRTQMGLVATREQFGEDHVNAVARYWLIPSDDPGLAEPAIVVEDRYQNRELGTLLLKRLVAYARAHGIHTFLASYDYDNVRITRIIRRSGLPAESRVELGICGIRVKLEPEPDD
jgi:GNAT superfamily N-acetyltransferase